MKKITIVQGDTLRRNIVLTYDNDSPVSLTGCEAFSQLRSWPGEELQAEAECVIDAALGRITVTYSADQTAALDPGDYGYDIRITSEGDVRTIWSERISIVVPYTEVENA